MFLTNDSLDFSFDIQSLETQLKRRIWLLQTPPVRGDAQWVVACWARASGTKGCFTLERHGTTLLVADLLRKFTAACLRLVADFPVTRRRSVARPSVTNMLPLCRPVLRITVSLI